MIYLSDFITIAVGYLLGVVVGFIVGCKRSKGRFWKMPSASWRVRRK